ncbi:low molecular weight protein-tyrosine-phosphatase [Sciscionella marina]|uniref:low molecular weight protein-tyrosine-phosphatase n=1 Tax=Sciscionella marina TaxID=508770 RepID=UPI000366546C|nr:low molecular weight protein-tyrosine-phosphatase [Sciscionella marina]
MTHVCFVCTGNICRSPMAESVLRAKLAEEGIEGVTVSSAGIGPWHAGEPMDERAAAVLAEAGYDDEHRAAQVNPNHIEADLLLAMDSGHRRALLRATDPGRVRLFRSFDPLAGETAAEVPDPYYGGEHGFTELLACIERCMPGLLEWIRTA